MIYYHLKPLIPRSVQLWLRRNLVHRKRSQFDNIWPIDERCGNPPPGWSGWPNNKRFALVLTHDVETGRGQKKCYPLIELEMQLGFCSSFNFVPEGYTVEVELRHYLIEHGFEVGVHGLNHGGNLFKSRKFFLSRVPKINHYLKEWKSVGFRAPSMYHNLEWVQDLEIEYDASTFDTDPFEPQPDGVETIFPFWIGWDSDSRGYVELPYTLPQDHGLFVIMKEKNIDIWKRKLDWIAENGGMALLITHPDYMNFDEKISGIEEYPARYYGEFLEYIKNNYEGEFWHVLPKEIALFWSENVSRNYLDKNLGSK
jgi:hypothetical protein